MTAFITTAVRSSNTADLCSGDVGTQTHLRSFSLRAKRECFLHYYTGASFLQSRQLYVLAGGLNVMFTDFYEPKSEY
jgi:hypothetical protein